SCPRASAPTSFSPRARATWSRRWRCGGCSTALCGLRSRALLQGAEHDSDRDCVDDRPQHEERQVEELPNERGFEGPEQLVGKIPKEPAGRRCGRGIERDGGDT